MNDLKRVAQGARVTLHFSIALADGRVVDSTKTGNPAPFTYGDGSLLDSSLLYFGAGMSNGLVHDRHNVPALLVGKAGGRVQGNRHLQAKEDEPTSNLLLGIADVMGAELETIGIANGRFAI